MVTRRNTSRLSVYGMTVVFILCFSALIDDIAYSQSWKFIKEKEGIQVYTRQEKESTLKSFRGEADIHAPFDKVYNILGNVNSTDHWDENIREFRVLSFKKDQSFSYYLIYKIPWPLHDRDLCVEARISRDTVSGEVIILAQSISSLKASPILPEAFPGGCIIR